MSELYDKARKLLTKENWTELTPSHFSKGDRELIFDTSTWIEIYEKDRGRVAEFKLQDFNKEICDLI